MRILQLPRHHALVGAVLLAVASQAFAQTPQTLIFNGGSDDRGNAIATDAPRSDNVSTMARPMPRDPPVTTATRPARLM